MESFKIFYNLNFTAVKAEIQWVLYHVGTKRVTLEVQCFLCQPMSGGQKMITASSFFFCCNTLSHTKCEKVHSPATLVFVRLFGPRAAKSYLLYLEHSDDVDLLPDLKVCVWKPCSVLYFTQSHCRWAPHHILYLLQHTQNNWEYLGPYLYFMSIHWVFISVWNL